MSFSFDNNQIIHDFADEDENVRKGNRLNESSNPDMTVPNVKNHDSGHHLPIRVISLESSIERHRYVQEQLDGLSLKHSISKAVEGNVLFPYEIEKIYDGETALSRRGKHLNRGEIGCALSHVKLYQEIVNDGLGAMLILEDDVKIDPEIRSVIKMWHDFPDNWDVIFLGCSTRRVFLKNISCRNVSSKRFVLAQAQGIGPVKGSFAYMVSYSGAKKLLDSTAMIYQPIDSYTGDLSSLNIYAFKPDVVSHSNLFPRTFWQNDRDKKLEPKDFENDDQIFSPLRLTAQKLLIASNKLHLSVKYRLVKFFLTAFDRFDSKSRQ